MLRLVEPSLSSGLGGWTPIASPPQRPAAGGQQWSVAIALIAALVALAAVVFDIRLPSDAALVAPAPPPLTVESAQPAVVSTSASAAAPAAGRAQPAATASPAEAGQSTATTGATTAAFTHKETAAAEGSAADAEALDAVVLLGDPAARVREYLGLRADEPLPVSFVYEVEAGDTASSIAQRFGLQEATVLFNNFDIYDPNQLTVGQALLLPPVDGLVYVVQPGDTLDAVLLNYQANLGATLAYGPNGISSPNQIYVGQSLLLVHGSASLAAGGGSASWSSGAPSGHVWTVPEFVLYLKYDRITDKFGVSRLNRLGYHTGVDFIAKEGELIGAAAAGIVSKAGWVGGYGKWVEIDHGGGYRSRYAHLQLINVYEGQWVEAGEYIGTVGNTGNSTGAHLHFEIIINGQAEDPLPWLN